MIVYTRLAQSYRYRCQGQFDRAFRWQISMLVRNENRREVHDTFHHRSGAQRRERFAHFPEHDGENSPTIYIISRRHPPPSTRRFRTQKQSDNRAANVISDAVRAHFRSKYRKSRASLTSRHRLGTRYRDTRPAVSFRVDVKSICGVVLSDKHSTHVAVPV